MIHKKFEIINKTVDILYLNHQGIGIATLPEQVVEVPFSLPDEHIDIELFHKAKKVPTGRILTVNQPHPKRCEPICKHFGVCGGCTLQHCTRDYHNQFKVNRLVTYLEHSKVTYNSISPLITIGPNKRRRIDFMGKKINNEMILGFHQRLNRQRFNVEMCPAIDPGLEAILAPLRRILNLIINEGQLVHVFATQADNGIDVLLAGLKQPFDCAQIELLKTLIPRLNITRLTFKVKTKAYEIYLKEIPYIDIAGYKVEISSNCFLQACKESDNILAQQVLDAIPKGMTQGVTKGVTQDVTKVADLFCGRGTLSLPLIRAGFKVDSYESDPYSLTELRKLNIETLSPIQRNLFDEPILTQDFGCYQAVVINPPRSGALAQIQQLAHTQHLQTIIYISCNPETFARDALILQDGGYKLKKVTPIDQFVWSAHLEVVGIFNR